MMLMLVLVLVFVMPVARASCRCSGRVPSLRCGLRFRRAREGGRARCRGLWRLGGGRKRRLRDLGWIFVLVCGWLFVVEFGFGVME